MKLFSKYNRINLLTTVIIFLLASIAYYFLLRYVLIEFVNDNLKIEQREIETYVSKYNRLPESMHVKDQQISYKAVTAAIPKRKYRTVPVFDSLENQSDLYRQLVFGINAEGQNYEVTVGINMEDMDDMIRSIIWITIGTILLILIATALINRLVLRRLWRPFYDSIAAIKNFQLGANDKLKLPSSNIEEFNLMNTTLDQSLNKAEQDYLLLKEFTANASHELQTPLAIIRSKMDILIQDEQLSETQSRAVQSAYDAIKKMAKLNQSLLLLTKIENRQFEETENINLREKLEEKTEEFHELWQNKSLRVENNLDDIIISMNPLLAEALLNNLLSNATRHNIPNGSIAITVGNDALRISNTGAGQPLDKSQLFNRFYKGSSSSENNGLGLCIVKQICDLYGFRLDYSFNAGLHTFEILLR